MPRILSIDALRGLTIAFMILVNDPGDWAHVYAPLDHAVWNGFTPTDLVFPMFLFLVGCSIVFSISARLKRGLPRRAIALQILRRAALLFAIKMFLTAYPHFHLTHLRIFGVLTRIAICYLLVALLYLALARLARPYIALTYITVAILLGYWALMRFVPVPGFGVPTHGFPILDPDRNLAAVLDRAFNAFTQRWLHTGLLYNHTHDPEGILSTLPACATTLLGVLAALWLRAGLPARRVFTGLLTFSVLCVFLGRVWNPIFPINKNLWTSSFVLYAGGWSFLLLALFYRVLDDLQLQQRSRIIRALVFPLLVFGSNALTAFILSNFLVVTAIAIRWTTPDGKVTTLWHWLYTLFLHPASTENTSLAFALTFVLLSFLPILVLYRRRIFLRL